MRTAEGEATRVDQGLQAIQLLNLRDEASRLPQRVLTALAEVEDARNASERSVERAKLIGAIVEEARLTARLANVRYIEGEEDLLSVLNAQTSLSDAEDAQVIGWQEQMFAQIALYRAMGGYFARDGEAENQGER